MEEIIPVTADNLEQCITLYSKVFNSEPWNENWTYEAAKNRLSDLLYTPKSLIFALFSHQQLVGFIGGNCKENDKGTTFYLAELCIDNQIQGKGYGSKLLSHLEKELKEKKVQSINKKRHPLTGMACFSNWNLLAVTLPFALPCLYYRLLLAW